MKAPLAVLLFALLPAAQEKVELRWKWEKGRELVYKAVRRSVAESGGPPMTQDESNTYSMTVLDVSPQGEASVRMKYLSVGSRGSSVLGEYEYDSEKDKEAPRQGPGVLYALLVGKSFTAKLTATGRVTEVGGVEAMLEAILKGLGDDAERARPQLQAVFTNDAFKTTMQQMFLGLPETKLGVADSWTNRFDVKMPMVGKVGTTVVSTLTSLDAREAKIEQAIQMELKEPEPNSPTPPELKEAKASAVATFSVEKGCFVSQKATTTMILSIGGRPVSMKTVADLTLIEKK